MNPTYKVGDVVQIISEEEVRSYPTDDRGNFILTPSLAYNFHRDKLPVCGRLAVITHIVKGNEMDLYDLTPYFVKDETVFSPWDDWFFSASEFHPYNVFSPPVSNPPMSFDDLLKGAAQ